ncbi:MAG TPA: helicase-related protein [Acetobacteraceae bacterium]|jgi:superfamily II DNA or RNA helicase
MDFAPGVRVSARGLAWEVIETERLGAQQLLRLRCDAGDLRGLEWELLHPNEKVDVLLADFRPESAGPLAAWRLHHIACLLDQVPGHGSILAAEPGRVRIEPYQLVPLMRALELPRPRLLLADGVGLGKTIQASLIAVELLARRRAHRVLVVSPAGPLLVQWEQELRQRFGLRFVAITDSATLQQERRRIELGGNPFDAIALCLISLDFAKQERVLDELERASWDLAIIDEAHHCISAGPAAEREETLRRRLAEVVARRSDGLLLLTATPHDGFDPHFASLIELLDPSLVDRNGGLAGTAYRRHVVRRLKSHIRDPATGAPLFRTRHVIPVRVEVTAEPVRVFHRALAALVAPRLKRASGTRQFADALAFVSLLKRSVSSIAACVKTLEVVAERYARLGNDAAEAAALKKERARALRAYRKRALQFGVLDAAAENDVAELEADDIAADLRGSADDMAAGLDALIRLGRAAAAADPKLAVVVREVRLIRAAYPAANVLIYTEYADSQLAVLQALRGVLDIEGAVIAISGLDSDQERSRAAERCAEQDGIILVSTDSLAEGLNLQQRCFHLIHLDLPYNPNRLEQRNGRIDRYGQTREPQIRYLYLAATFEERLLLRLIAKYEKARCRLDFMPETLGVTADEESFGRGLMAGFAEEQALLFEDEAPTVRMLDQIGQETNAEAYRDLVHEIDRAFEGYERIAARHGWLADRGLNADAALVAQADAGRHRGDVSLGHTDLLEFVAETLGAAASDVIPVPDDWGAGLSGLPGFDDATGTLRVTRRREVMRDPQGRSLAFLGLAHPLVRRAIARARCSEAAVDGGRVDIRASAARADAGAPLSLLCTFAAELHNARCVAWQSVIAVLLPISGPAVEQPNPAIWLNLAERNRAIPAADVWRCFYADWASARRAEAASVAMATMQRLTAQFTAVQTAIEERESGNVRRWLSNRANGVCGTRIAQVEDLFGAPVIGPRWQLLDDPIERLTAFAVDPDNTPARRREASSAIELFKRRSKESIERLAFAPPVLRPLGLLMLLPPELLA